MEDEIKGILNRLEKIGYYASVPKELAYMTTNITPQECKTILDYITNLQQELQITQEKWNKDKQWVECRTKEWLDYKSRIEKAVEYIKNCPEYLWENINTKELLNILNGRSDE